MSSTELIPSALAPEQHTLGFTLRLESGRAVVDAKDRPLGGGLHLARLEMEIPNVKFPFDVSGGAERFRSQRCMLRTLVLQLPNNALAQLLQHDNVKEAGFSHLDLGLSGTPSQEGTLVVSGLFRQGAFSAPFSFNFAPMVTQPRELLLFTFDERIYGPLPLPAARLPWLMMQALGALPRDGSSPAFDLVGLFVRQLLPRYGWKIPETDGIGLLSAEVSKQGLVVAAGHRLLQGSPAAMRAALAYEARTAFEPAEAKLFRGEDAAAYAIFRTAMGEETPARFAVRRLLQLASANEAHAEEGRSVAEESLVRDAQDQDALLYMAQYALSEGDLNSAARSFALLAEALWAEGSERAAALADVAAAEAGRDIARPIARASIERTLHKRRNDVRALHMLFHLEREEGDLAAAGAAGERLLRALPEAERTDIHLALGELFLGRDLKRAKLHAERALRANMEDPRAMRLVARVFAASGDPARAIRYLSRLAERAQHTGDASQALELEIEITSHLEATSAEPPRALLARYQRILTLAPEQREAQLRAAQIAYALEEFSLARRYYEDLSEDPRAEVRSEAAFCLGQIAMREGRELEAEVHFESAVTGARSEAAYLALVKIYERRGDRRASYRLEDLLAQRATDPARAVDHHLRAAAAALPDNSTAAVKHLRAALVASPSHAQIKERLLDILSDVRDEQDKEQLLTEWADIEHEPQTRCEWYLRLAALKENRGDWAAAKNALMQAIKADPASIEANEALYTVCQKLNEPYGSFEALGNIARYRHDGDEARAEIRVTQAELLAGPLKRRDEARAYLLRALADLPHHARGLWLLGELAAEADDFAMAEDAWQRYLESGAEDRRTLALQKLAEWAQARGDSDRATEVLQLWWHETRSHEALQALADALKNRGEFHRIAEVLRDAASEVSGEERERLQWETALVYRDSIGNWENARRELLVLSENDSTYGQQARQALVALARDEGRSDLLAAALEKELRFAPTTEHLDLHLAIARAHREAGDGALASAAYAWVLDHDPSEAEALAYIAEQAEETGNYSVAFEHQLDLLSFGDDNAERALTRLTPHVSLDMLVQVIQRAEHLPLAWAKEMAKRFESVGRIEAALAVLDKTVSVMREPEARMELVFEQLRLEQDGLSDPGIALERMQAEYASFPDFAPYRDRYEQLVDRAGNERQRAELALERATRDHDPEAQWQAWQGLRTLDPTHPSLAPAYAELASEPALRAGMVAFLLDSTSAETIGAETRVLALAALDAQEPLADASRLVLAAMLRDQGDADNKTVGTTTAAQRANAIYRDLFLASPTDDSLFGLWSSGLGEEARHAAKMLRFERASESYLSAGNSVAYAHALEDAANDTLISADRFAEVRDAFVRAGDNERAIVWAERVTTASADSLSAWLIRFDLTLAEGDVSRAMPILAAVEARELAAQDLQQFRWQVTEMLLRRTHHAEAETVLEDMLALEPGHEAAYEALAALHENTPSLLLPFARRRAHALGDPGARRQWLAIAQAARATEESLKAIAEMAAQAELSEELLATAFELAVGDTELLNGVWDWAEEPALALADAGLRRLAHICSRTAEDNASAAEIQEALLVAVREKTDEDARFVAQQWLAVGQPERVLVLLGERDLDTGSPELRRLWLEAAADQPTAYRDGLEMLSRHEEASEDETLALASLRLESGEQNEALALLSLLRGDERAEALFVRAKTEQAQAALLADPHRALALAREILGADPDNAQAQALALSAARAAGDSDAVFELLAGRDLSPEEQAEIAAIERARGNMQDAARDLFAAYERDNSHDDWLRGALDALSVSGDRRAFAEALVRYADASPGISALERMEEAIALYRDLAATDPKAREDEHFVAERIFDLAPERTSSFARLIGYLGEPGQESAQLHVWIRHLQALPENERKALSVQAARFALDRAHDPEAALDIIAQEFGEGVDDVDALELEVSALTALERRSEALPLLQRIAMRAATEADKAGALRRAADIATLEGDEHQAAVLWAAAVTVLPASSDWSNRETYLANLELAVQAKVHRALLPLLSGDAERQALSELSHLSQALAQTDEALTFAQRALALDPESKELRQRVRGLLQTSEDTAALVQHLSEEHGSSLDRHQRYELALEIAKLCEQKLGDKDQAEHFYRQALKDGASELAPLHALARLYEARGAKSELAQTLEAQLPLMEEGRARGELATHIGDLRIELGQLDAAVSAYVHAFADGLSSPGIRKVVTTAAKRGVHREQALEQLQRLAEIGALEERGPALRDAADIEGDSDPAQAAALLTRAGDFGTLMRADHLQILSWSIKAGDLPRAMGLLRDLAEGADSAAEAVALSQQRLALAHEANDKEEELAALQVLEKRDALPFAETLELADLLTERNEREESVQVLVRALDHAKTASAIDAVKHALLARGQADAVIELLSNRNGPERAESLAEAARLCEVILGDSERSYELYKEALSAGGAIAQEDLGTLASLAQNRGDDTTLAAVYVRIAESDAPPEVRASAYLSMAKVWIAKDSRRAEDCLRACLRLDPENRDAIRALADVLGQQGRGQELAPLLAKLEPSASASEETRAAWALEAADAAIAAGDENGALQRYLQAAPYSEQALWAAFDLRVKRAENVGAIALVLQRLQQGALKTNDLTRVKTAAQLAHELGHGAPDNSESELLLKLAEMSAADSVMLGRLTDLLRKRGDNAGALRWMMRRAEGLSGIERATALIEIARSSRDAGDIENARALLEEAFNLAPSAPPALEALFGLYRELGDAERMLVVGERLVIVDANEQRPREFYLALAEAALALNDRKRAVEFYALAHEREALSGALLERAIDAAAGSGQERQRLAWEEQRVEQSGGSTQEFMRLGMIARDNLGDIARSEHFFRRAMALDPAAQEPLRALVDTILSDGTRVPEAIELYRTFLVASPCDIEAYRTLARLYGQVGDVDRTYLAYDALIAIDASDDEAGKFVAAARSILPELPARPLSPTELGQLADPGLRSPWQHFYAPLAAQAELLYPGDIARFGLSDANRLPAAQGLGRRVALVAQRFGGRAPEVQPYLANVQGGEASIEPGAPPKLVASAELQQQSVKSVHFALARAFALLSLGHLLPSRLRDSDLVTMVCILAKRFLPDLSVPDVAQDRVEAMLARFRIVTPEDNWGPHGAVARSFVASLGSHEEIARAVREWVEAGERSADRWALLISGELGAAFASARQSQGSLLPALPPSGPERAQAIEARADLTDLLQFALSDTYVAIRQALGLTLVRT